MTKKKTIFFTVLLAFALIIGILTFSGGIQSFWQSKEETESTIEITNSENAANLNAINYPFESIVNMKEDTFSKDSLINTIYNEDENFLPLQDAVNKVGEFLKLNYGFTEAQTTTAYANYIMQFGPNSPQVFHFITIDNNTYMTILNGFTHEIMDFRLEVVTTVPQNTPTINDYDTDVWQTEVSDEEKILIDEKVKETLGVLGYTQTVASSEYGNEIQILAYDIYGENVDKYVYRYRVSCKLNDDSIVEFTFLKTYNDLMLSTFYDVSAHDRFISAVEELRIVETKDSPSVNLKLNVDYPFKSFTEMSTDFSPFYNEIAENVVQNPDVNTSLQDANNMIGEFISLQYPSITFEDITAYIDYIAHIEGSTDSEHIEYRSDFWIDNINIGVTSVINPMTHEILRVDMFYLNNVLDNDILLTQKEADNISNTTIDEKVKNLINENIDKTLEFLGYKSEIMSIEYSIAVLTHDVPLANTPYSVAYSCKIILSDETNIVIIYTGGEDGLNVRHFYDNSAHARFSS